ncbi:MAG: YhfC family glutamic-type intramembrane protease [Sandaracinaceae bacterium]
MAVGYAVEVVLIVAFTVGLAAWLRRRTKVGYALAGVGALTFLASQLVHFPLLWAFGQLPASVLGSVPLSVAMFGLSAGLCEELARYVVVRWLRTDVRHTQGALMLGVGHGGVEALITAGLAAITMVNLLALDRVGSTGLGLDDNQTFAVQQAMHDISDAPPWLPLLGALERVMVLPFHIAASMLVTYAVTKKEARWLVLAIALHALLDGPLVYITPTYGLGAALVFIAAVSLATVLIASRLARRLLRVDAEVVPVEPSGAPIELALASKSYPGGVRALSESTLVIEPGTRTCLLGPNGAGKTTTIRLITGGLVPSSGHAWLFGKSTHDADFLAAKRRLGIVPQQPGMYEDLSVRAWLELVRDVYGKGDVERTAAELGIADLLERPMAHLSGGQKRKIAIAAAVIGEPELLVLDEPSAGLDPIAAHEVTEFLQRLSTSHTILLCTHDLDEAELLCDRVVVMRDGRVAVHEAIDALRARMAPRIALRATDGAALARALEAQGRASDVLRRERLLAVEDPETDAPAILRALLAEGVDVVECRVVKASLEELFLEIVQAPVERATGAPPAAEVEPVAPAISFSELFGPLTRRLAQKEWRQLRASGSAFWTSVLVPALFLGVVPQILLFATRNAEAEGAPDSVPSFGALGEVAEDPRRAVVAVLPMFITLAALTAPTALITHSILTEREKRTLELLVALPVRIQQVVLAKLATVVLFATSVCGVLLLALGVELLAFDMATVFDVLALVVMLACVLAQGTAGSLMVALLARDFRTANNLAGLVIVPAIFVVVAVIGASPGGVVRPLVLAFVFAVAALAIGRAALRTATFERLLA